MDIKNKIAIVTGASSGIGTEFSRKLIQEGATVYGLARNIDRLKELQNILGESFLPVKMDVTDHEKIASWVGKTFTEGKGPDILINNAGLGLFGPVDELKLEDWETMMNVNVNGIFYLTRQIVPLMKRSGSHSHIINIASIAGMLGNPNLSGYNATKFAVRGFSEALFKELRYDKIKVSCMFPGSIATSFFDNVDESETHDNMMQPEDVADTLMHLLKTPDNMLINEIVMRPLNPKNPNES
ncbi:SDR family oxidoreductase [Rhodohalobacter sp. SW132]|uniref:SDR family oxidoreductase n=1 Tax=Rhodohalobacter sp. SW132 TaxID=2293433 RepID=UPI000E264235|nr:SDR family oxidoreductase [Rhodohalobacter sp. SW132]REL33860.1 SDR family oxidoreductase [Rhodohalobacter sp. SW132]